MTRARSRTSLQASQVAFSRRRSGSLVISSSPRKRAVAVSMVDGPQRALGSVDALAARWTSKGAGPQKAASPGALDSRALVFTVSPPQRIGDPELRTLAVRRRAGSIGAWGSLPDDLSGIT